MKITKQRLKEIIKEEIASMEEAAEGEGCTVLPGTRVQHKRTKQKGYRCTGTKTGSGHGAKYWGIKWDDGSWDRDVPSDDVISLKDK